MSNSNNQAKQDNPVKVAIANYLQKRASEDEQFAVSFAKPNKSIDECFDYIIGEVRKMGTAVYLPDDEVFCMAVHYYDEDEIKVSPLPKGEKLSTTPLTAEKPREAKSDTFSEVFKPKAKVKPEPKPQNGQQQLSLFDFLDDESNETEK